MIVVLASRHDRACGRLVADWAGHASLLTCQDLSVRGWRYGPGGVADAAVLGGRLTRAGEIEGVLTRLPRVDQSELGHIVPGDRGYVAEEMTAFLAAWLSDLRCPVLNRPTATCLLGPVLATGEVGAHRGQAGDSGRHRVPVRPGRDA